MQIYGIDLAKEKFDVSFFDLTSKKVSNQPSHKVVTNNLKGIGKLVEGEDAKTVANKILGTTCGFKQTSCPDQLAKAILSVLEN